MPSDKLNLDWSAVEKALAEGTFSGYKIGILETEKLFAEMLKSKNVPGRTIETQIKYLRNFFSMPEKLEEARLIYKKIVGEPALELSREETKKLISNYWQAMIDIDDMVKYLGIWEKWQIKLHYLWNAILVKKIKSVTLIILAILALFLILGETKIGQLVFKYIVALAHFIILKIIFWLGVILAVLYLLKIIIGLILKTKKSV